MLNRVILIGNDEHQVTGRKKTAKGYIACCVKTHPFAGKDGYVFEHRLMVEQKLGRYLLRFEAVHHINGVKNDNSLENLEVMSHGEHTTLTHTGLKRSGETRNKLSAKARERFKDHRNHPEYRYIPQNEMVSYYRKFGAKETADKYGVTRRVIYNRLHQWGVKVNNAQ